MATDNKKSTPRKATDFDRWQLHRLKAFLQANSARAVVDWTLIAELQACKGYLEEVGLGHLIPLLEEAEQLRVLGAFLRPPGADGLPEGCVACFAAEGPAVGIETETIRPTEGG